MEDNLLERIRSNPEMVVRYAASRKFVNFARYMKPKLDMTDFHKVYYEVLDRFAKGEIRRLIVSVPPQHGKSEGSSRLLPAFILGLNPDKKIVIGSYNADVAKNFNRDAQRTIRSEQYRAIFPASRTNNDRVTVGNVYKCNADTTEIVGHTGWLNAVGRNGALTSKTVDIAILDDLYKDFQEASSPTIREITWNWFTTVVKSRLHNKSQELIVFTRWHEDDLIGRLVKGGEQVIVVKSWEDIINAPKDAYILLNFPAIKVGEPTELDPRLEGEPLWPEMHSLKELEDARKLDPVNFECLYQGDPGSAEGRLYGEFKTYTDKSEYGRLVRKGCMIDVADKGTDFLCAISYDIYLSPNTTFNEKTRRWEPILFALVTDIEFTQKGTDITYVTVPRMINYNGTQKVFCESNAGGEQFGKTVAKKIRATMEQYFTTLNKESKILTNAAAVNRSIVFPLGWETKWPTFYHHITHFLRFFKGNKHDDGPDCLSEIYLRDIEPGSTKPYHVKGRGPKRAN